MGRVGSRGGDTTCRALRPIDRSQNGLGRGAPIREDPDFREVLVLAIVIVVFCEHFTQLFGELVGLALIRGVVLAALVVADPKPRSAAIAQLESFNRIGGYLAISLSRMATGLFKSLVMSSSAGVEDFWLNYGSFGAERLWVEPVPSVADRCILTRNGKPGPVEFV